MPFTPRQESLIAALRGLPDERDGGDGRGSLLPLGSLLEVLVQKHRIGQPKLEEVIMTNWRELLGRDAERCVPKCVKGRALIVAVPNAVLRQEIQFRKRAILARLQALPGCGHLDALVLQDG